VIAGVGCSLGCSAQELLDLVDAAAREAGVTVTALATVDRRSEEPGIVAAAEQRGWPLHTFPPAALATVDVPTPSAVVAAHVGTSSVAEAAALLAGAGELIVPKRRSAHATCAIATTAEEAAAWP
jgi:cobalamin biosynthesis protein CbiG